MPAPKTITWQNFLKTAFVAGEKRVHRVSERPRIDLFGDGAAGRIGLIVDLPTDEPLPDAFGRCRSLEFRRLASVGTTRLEVSPHSADLHHQFFHFATAIAERILANGTQPILAISQELDGFGALLEEKAILGIERQVGLIGELLFLELLLAGQGPTAVQAWIGPLREPHDFRVGMHEYEVKATLSPRRVHTIHGSDQLSPSKGCSLFLISVVLGPTSGASGFSLASKVGEIKAALTGHDTLTDLFDRSLASNGYRKADEPHYTRRLALRRPLGAVRIDSSFPTIARPQLQQFLGDLAIRIPDWQYDVDVEGLEHEQGSPAFTAALTQ